MKILKSLLSFVLLGSLLISCGGDDDICDKGEGTPRLKLKFKDASTGKLKKMDSLYVFVDYGKDTISLGKLAKVDSLYVPLRVDDAPFTDIFVKTTWMGTTSKIKLNYTTKSIYVSPACGMKLNYENLSPQLLQASPVQAVENNQNSITDESKTNLYLLF